MSHPREYFLQTPSTCFVLDKEIRIRFALCRSQLTKGHSLLSVIMAESFKNNKQVIYKTRQLSIQLNGLIEKTQKAIEINIQLS